MLNESILSELQRLAAIGCNNIFQQQQRLGALFEFETIYKKLSKEEKSQYEKFLYLSYRERAIL